MRLLNPDQGLGPWVNPGSPGGTFQGKVTSKGLEGTASQVQTDPNGRRVGHGQVLSSWRSDVVKAG